VALVGRSRYLQLLVAMVALVQLSIALIDFQYNGLLERAYPALDARTDVIGKIYAANDFCALGLQMLTGPIFALIGVRVTLLGIPVLLAAVACTFAAAPTFLWVAVLKVAVKCVDYSLLRAAKEILYIPLSPEEKVHGKSIVDIFTYRVAKGAAALLLIVVVVPPGSQLGAALVLGALIGWIVVATVIYERTRGLEQAEAKE
jgi:AAA family ATP:ADP antiporter